jgi:hypothetical protein
MLNISGYDFTVNFAWTDNVHDEADAGERGNTEYKYTTFSGDIMDFYISGDVAPAGRFKFSYVSTNENATGESTETEAPTEQPTEPVETPTEQPTDDETEAPTDAPATDAPVTDAETEAPKKGFGSSVALGSAVILMTMAAAVALKKKD